MKNIFEKKCKECSTIFTPYRSTDSLCYVCTKTRQAIKNLEKIKKERVKRLKVDLMTLQDWFKIAQQHFNRYINLRELIINETKPFYVKVYQWLCTKLKK